MHPPQLSDPLWYKDAVIYELHVRAFQDAQSDGIGDFRGLTEKLDYLQSLGVTVVWLLPFFASPWRDDGYDISDYREVHPAYGTLRDFQDFLAEAHRRGLRVITELVMNHTSDEHPWFQRSRRAEAGSSWRDFYVWSDNPNRYADARIIFKDFETSNWTWDPVAKAYFWHRFYSHQPDLNFDNPAVRKAMLETVDFWFDMGVDGLRLDAVPYLFEREGTNCENLPETHAFLKELRARVDQKYKDRMLLAEANQWPDDSIAYFGSGDECHMAFHFPLMPRLFMAHRMEDRFPIIDILEQTPAIPANCQWALFLRNHDELTLEMVTDEERDYMYRSYAHDTQARINLGIRRRLAPLLNNDRRRIELMNALLFSMPGAPVVYYGDEIGMGDNIFLGDRNGVRTPMQWSSDRNAGFSRANPQRLYLPVIIDPEYHYEAVNVEAQQANPSSLLWWMKHLIALRKNSRALSRGSLEFLHPDNRRVLAFVRHYEDETVLMVANLSRFPQNVELDLSRYRGFVPMEMLGRTDFPAVGEMPYFITVGRHGYYWFQLQAPKPAQDVIPQRPGELPPLTVERWDQPLNPRMQTALSRVLPSFLENWPTFPSRARRLRNVDVFEALPLEGTPLESGHSYLVLARAEYRDGDPEVYLFPIAFARGDRGAQVRTHLGDYVLGKLRGIDGEEGLLYRAIWDDAFRKALLELILNERRIRGLAGDLAGFSSPRLREILGSGGAPDSQVKPPREGNALVQYSAPVVLKLYRRLDAGINSELEIGQFLGRKHFPGASALIGWIEYQPASRAAGDPAIAAVAYEAVTGHGEAWDYTTDSLARFFEEAVTRGGDPAHVPHIAGTPLDLIDQPLPAPAQELLGVYLENARLLGKHTAELHLALADSGGEPAFLPEPFTDLYRKALYHGMTALSNRTFDRLQQRVRGLPPEVQETAAAVLAQEDSVREFLRPVRDQRITAMRIRTHGNLNLRQFAFTGKDFVIIDFEGEASRPMSERRIKRSGLRDVASMLRSFHYAAYSVLFGQIPGLITMMETRPLLERWARFWFLCAGGAYLNGYLAAAGDAAFMPRSRGEFRLLLSAYLMEKAVQDLGAELSDRSEWVRIPLLGILQLLEPPQA